MKINFNEKDQKGKKRKNTEKKEGKIETFTKVRPWAEVIKLEGVQGGHVLKAEAKTKKLAFQTISPQKINIKGDLEISTKKFIQKKGNSKVKIKWDKTLQAIPELHQNIELETIIKIPDNKANIKLVKTIKPEIRSVNATTLPNRIVLKGEVAFCIVYYVNSLF